MQGDYCCSQALHAMNYSIKLCVGYLKTSLPNNEGIQKKKKKIFGRILESELSSFSALLNVYNLGFSVNVTDPSLCVERPVSVISWLTSNVYITNTTLLK